MLTDFLQKGSNLRSLELEPEVRLVPGVLAGPTESGRRTRRLARGRFFVRECDRLQAECRRDEEQERHLDVCQRVVEEHARPVARACDATRGDEVSVRANEAAGYVRSNIVRSGDIWKFINDVGDFLTRHFESPADDSGSVEVPSESVTEVVSA